MKVLAVSGSSGGHILPALSFLEALKDRRKGIDTLLVLPRNSLTSQGLLNGYTINYVPISAIKLALDYKNLKALFRFLSGSLKSLIILIKFKPDIVVGFGSLVCIPMVIFAWVFRIRTLIHEQNVIPGMANRLLSRFSDRIAISFQETGNYFHNSKAKVVFTGNLIRKNLKRIKQKDALDFFGFDYDNFTILVMGGSQGSHSVNINFLNALTNLVKKHKMQVIHITGGKDNTVLRDNYRKLEMNFKLFDFFNMMQYAYSAANLVISRAGATTIAEIIYFKVPAIIIPYPFAYRHQIANAKILKNRGCAIVIQDNELEAHRLEQELDSLIDNPDKIKTMLSGFDYFPIMDTNNNFMQEVFR